MLTLYSHYAAAESIHGKRLGFLLRVLGPSLLQGLNLVRAISTQKEKTKLTIVIHSVALRVLRYR